MKYMIEILKSSGSWNDRREIEVSNMMNAVEEVFYMMDIDDSELQDAQAVRITLIRDNEREE
jgi:hypothetical protein